jgi:hypothetical protein
MGGEPWFYIVPYQPDISKVLTDLKRREFEAGRYNPVQGFPLFPVDPSAPSPGAQHATIEEAVRAAGASGTRSILDMQRAANDPDDIDYGVITPLSDEFLVDSFGTTKPTREMIEEGSDITEGADRGQGIYTVIYRNGLPVEIFVAGTSYD